LAERLFSYGSPRKNLCKHRCLHSYTEQKGGAAIGKRGSTLGFSDR
jgi:hypothetical protein